MSDASDVFRVAAISRAEANSEDRSIPMVLATETPVRRYDDEVGRIVHEIIEMRGIELPQNKQVPLLDGHDREKVLGSVRNLRVEGSELHGRAYFSRRPEAVARFEEYADGHLTDFSVFVRAEQSGVHYDGNTRRIRRSRLMEGSAVSIGADPNAKALLARRSYLEPEQLRDEAMYEKLRELLVQRGLKKDADDAEVLAFAETELKRTDATAEQVKELGDVLRAIKPAETPKPSKPTAQVEVVDEATIVRAERTRVAEIHEVCRAHGVEAEKRDKWVSEGVDLATVSRSILDGLKPKAVPTGGSPLHIQSGVSEREKFYAGVSDALVQRCLSGQKLSPQKGIEAAKASNDFEAVQRCEQVQRSFEKPADGYQRFRYMPLYDIARTFLEMAGTVVDGLARPQIVARAMAMQDFCQVRRGDGPAYHTTGSFANLMLDAANKTLRTAYDEAPSSWEMWVRRAPSMPDLKAINRIQLGAVPNPEEIPENGPYPQTTTTDSSETYKPSKKGQIFSLTLESVINDDLDALSRLPAMHGAAMRRRINADCYAVLIANGALSDGNALFSTAHGANGDNNAISVTNLNAAFTKMAIQTALGASGAIMNLEPRYLIVPKALWGLAWQTLNSIADPAAGGSAAGNSNTRNAYGPGGARGLTIVSDGVLDASSTAIWYLACEPSQIDTVEITFLQGYEAPVIEREEGFETDTIKTKIKQFYGVKAIDYRGLYRGGTTIA